MRPRKKEIDKAWKVHDRRPDDFKCQEEKDWNKKQTHCPSCHENVKINWREGIPYCSTKKCGEKLHVENFGHSHFNKVCQRMVMEYAKEHPIPRQRSEPPPKVVKVKCAGCFKMKSKQRMTPFMKKQYCSNCIKRAKRRGELERKRKEQEIVRMEKLEREAPNNCPRDTFGHFELENSTCLQKCHGDQKEFCRQKTMEKVKANKTLVSCPKLPPKS